MNNKELMGTINDDEKKVINKVYFYQIKEVEQIRAEEIACTLDDSKDDIVNYNWDKFQSITSTLMNKGILNKNGDRYSIKDEKIYPLIDAGIINISKIINVLSIDTFYTKCDLRKIENEICGLKNKKENLEDELNVIKQQINEYKEIANNSAKILDEHKIKLVEFMGIFISIFTLISVNVNFIKLLENIKEFYNIILILICINIITVSSLLTMLRYINKKILNK